MDVPGPVIVRPAELGGQEAASSTTRDWPCSSEDVGYLIGTELEDALTARPGRKAAAVPVAL